MYLREANRSVEILNHRTYYFVTANFIRRLSLVRGRCVEFRLDIAFCYIITADLFRKLNTQPVIMKRISCIELTRFLCFLSSFVCLFCLFLFLLLFLLFLNLVFCLFVCHFHVFTRLHVL